MSDEGNYSRRLRESMEQMEEQNQKLFSSSPKEQAHEAATTILASFCRSWRWDFTPFTQGSDAGKFLGEAYKEIFERVLEADKSVHPYEGE